MSDRPVHVTQKSYNAQPSGDRYRDSAAGKTFGKGGFKKGGGGGTRACVRACVLADVT